MKYIIVLSFCFVLSVNAQSVLGDTLIEPGKENPQIMPPDSIPFPPDSIEDQDTSASETDTANNSISYAFVELSPTAGNTGSGKLTFTKVDNGIKINGEITGLSPGQHGIHIHETGDCSAIDASSAGGHFNPDQMPHGAPENVQRHTGDLGNIEADDNGTATIDMTDTKISFEGVNSIIGKAVIVHSGKDDLKSQPAGDSGGRILCGVIEKKDSNK